MFNTLMASIWVIIQLLVLALPLALLFHLLLFKNKSKNLPPGPKGFPIFGSLHLLGKLPHRDLHRLSRRYGPIMHMKLGLVHTIVISSPVAAELFLKTHDLVFASRPRNEVLQHMSYGQKDMVFAPYGPYWRNMRKMCTLELLSNHKVDSFKSMRREEVRLLIDYLREAARSSAVVDLSLKVSSLNANITCLMIFGKKYEDEEFDERGFKVVVHEALKLAASFNLADFIPCIAMLDLQGFKRRAKSVGKVFDDFFERIIEEHKKFKNEDKTKDFVDIMLDIMGSQEAEYHIDRCSIKAIILDMLLAAMDTSFTAIEWAISELIKHPWVMKKMQEELEKVVGLNRKVEESDLIHCEYLDMIVKETLRLHPPGPLLVPHESLEDCIVNKFHIPKGSRIIVNGWSIARDPSVWIDAEKFSPERFIGSQIDVKGRDFQLIPFGSGRRGCPGIQMGLTTFRLVLAQLVHSFDWELPNEMVPTELNMTEEFGLTSPRAQHLMVIPSYRLCD